ncbi:MAG: HesA/MoeB/ThiF family protein [Thermoplasmatota archaeon]
MSETRLAILRQAWHPIVAAIDGSDGDEEGGFLLARIHRTRHGIRLVADEFLDAPDGRKWRLQGPAQLAPTTAYMSHAAGSADLSNRIPVFVHNHPPTYADFSPADEWAHEAWAPFFVNNTTLQGFVSLVVAGGKVIGDLWLDDTRIPIDIIQCMDTEPTRTVRDLDAVPIYDEDDRHARLWKKEGQRRIRSGRIAVAGAGGTGSAAIEQLARSGVGSLLVIDPDTVSLTNLNRLYGSTWQDAKKETLKVDVAKRHAATFSRTQIDAVNGNVLDADLLDDLLHCDVLLGGTDSHASRAQLNDIALHYGIPYIDAGCKVHVDGDEILGQWADIRRVTQGGPCLWCMKVLDPQRILAEGLPDHTRNRMVKDGYIQGDGIEPSTVSMTTLAATALCTQAIGHLLSTATHWPMHVLIDAWGGDQLRPPTERLATCICSGPKKRTKPVKVTS